MTIWLIEPRDPLIVREGRPFGSSPGAYATSLPFPFPSTMAGGARARTALDEDGFFKYDRKNDRKDLDELKKISIRGPLLVQLADEGDVIAQHLDEDAWLVPIPGDAQFFERKIKEGKTTKKEILLRRLVPLEAQITFDEQEDIQQAGKKQVHLDGLHLVGLPPADQLQGIRKPYSHKQRYWYWQYFQSWLLDPEQLTKEKNIEPSLLGHEDLIRDHRMHVSMDYDKDVGKDGLLFGTSGLEFTVPGKGGERLHNARRLALAIEVEDKTTPQAGVAGFGGERRLVTWRRSDAQFPPCSNDIKEKIKKTGYCRLVLLTPASFEHGYYPIWLRSTLAADCNVKVDIQAIAVRRPQVVSGWDLKEGVPKPSRRLAPAGTVFFLSVQGDADERAAWIEKTWMKSISDSEQDRRDGFGLAALGTWSGELAPMDEGK